MEDKFKLELFNQKSVEFKKSYAGREEGMRYYTWEEPFLLNNYVIKQMTFYALYRPKGEKSRLIKIRLEWDGDDLGIYFLSDGEVLRELSSDEDYALHRLLFGNEDSIEENFHYDEVIDKFVEHFHGVVTEMLEVPLGTNHSWFDVGYSPDMLDEFVESFYHQVHEDNWLVYFNEGDDEFKEFLHSLY